MVYGARDEFLARARLAVDEYVRVRGGDLLDESEDLLQRFRRADDLGEAVALIQLAAQCAVLAEQLALTERVLDRMKKVFVDERFGDVVVSALAQGGDRGVNGRVGGHHDDERFGVNVFDAVEERK